MNKKKLLKFISMPLIGISLASPIIAFSIANSIETRFISKDGSLDISLSQDVPSLVNTLSDNDKTQISNYSLEQSVIDYANQIPWWGYLIIAVGTLLIIISIIIFIVLIKKKNKDIEESRFKRINNSGPIVGYASPLPHEQGFQNGFPGPQPIQGPNGHHMPPRNNGQHLGPGPMPPGNQAVHLGSPPPPPHFHEQGRRRH